MLCVVMLLISSGLCLYRLFAQTVALVVDWHDLKMFSVALMFTLASLLPLLK